MTAKAVKPPCPICGKTHIRGGCRSNAGRPKEGVGATLEQGVAVEVLRRLPELGIDKVKTEADYVLHLMRENPKLAPAIFSDMLSRKYGTPTRAVVAEGKLEIIVRELGSGNSASAETGDTAPIM